MAGGRRSRSRPQRRPASGPSYAVPTSSISPSAPSTTSFGITRQHLSAIVDLFNLLDLSSATNTGSNTANQAGFEARNSVSYGAATNRQVPFRVQFGVRYQY